MIRKIIKIIKWLYEPINNEDGFTLRSFGKLLGKASPLGLVGGSLLGGGILSDLFGGKEGEIKTKQVPRWTPEQQKLFESMLGLVSPQIGKPWALAPTAEEAAYMRTLGGFEPWYRELAEEVYGTEPTKTYFREQMYPEWESEVRPRIEAQYAGPGYWGSARAEAVSGSLEDLAAKEAEALYQTEMSRRGMIAQLGALAPTMSEALARESRRYAEVEPALSPYYGLGMGLLNLEPYYTLGGMTQPQPSILSGLMGGLGQGLGQMLPLLLKLGPAAAAVA